MLQTDRRRVLKMLLLSSLVPLLHGDAQNSSAQWARQGNAGGPNVLILLFDSLSARHMSLYGYRRDTTPNLARFAERATVYHAHHAAGNFTTPSTASFWTGTYPWQHRALHRGGLMTAENERRNLLRLYPKEYRRILLPHNLWADLLMQQLRQAGDLYITPEEACSAAYTFPDSLFAHDKDVSFRALFDFIFRSAEVSGSLLFGTAKDVLMRSRTEDIVRQHANLYPQGVPQLSLYHFFVMEQISDWVSDSLQQVHQPFLAYFHFYPPHEPYYPGRAFIGRFADGWAPSSKTPHPLGTGMPQEELDALRIRYDEYIAHVDAEFGRLLAFLEETDLLENSYVVVTSDHGQLFERGVHGHLTELLYEPVIHIPLIISRPGERQRVDVHTPTSNVDVVPTLLHLLGQPIPDWCEGELLPGVGAAAAPDERPVYVLEAKQNPAYDPLRIGTLALIRGRYKLIHYFGYPGLGNGYEMYDLVNDPEELENLYSVHRSTAAELQHEMEAKLELVNRPYRSG